MPKPAESLENDSIIEEEKQDVGRKFGLHSPIYCETPTGSRRVRVCKKRVTKESLYE